MKKTSPKRITFLMRDIDQEIARYGDAIKYPYYVKFIDGTVWGTFSRKMDAERAVRMLGKGRVLKRIR